MTYRGKKYLEIMRALEKKSVLSEEDLAGKCRLIRREAAYTAPTSPEAVPPAPMISETYTYQEPEPKIDSQALKLAEEHKSSVVNFMEGISYNINPVDTLKMITASSVFGEPQYYRDGDTARAKILDGTEFY